MKTIDELARGLPPRIAKNDRWLWGSDWFHKLPSDKHRLVWLRLISLAEDGWCGMTTSYGPLAFEVGTTDKKSDAILADFEQMGAIVERAHCILVVPFVDERIDPAKPRRLVVEALLNPPGYSDWSDEPLEMWLERHPDYGSGSANLAAMMREVRRLLTLHKKWAAERDAAKQGSLALGATQ